MEDVFFFPQDYLNFKLVDQNFFEHENYLGLQIGRNNLNKSKNNIKKINFSENFKFSFFSELNDNELIELTNLEAKNVEDSKKRQFSDPILERYKNKIANFQKKIKRKKKLLSLRVEDFFTLIWTATKVKQLINS